MLITFDDGYRDILENALPVLAAHGYKAVIFIRSPTWRTTPLPHESRSCSAACATRRSTGASSRELDAGGVRVESHGIAHRPLAEVSLDEAVREIAVSKLKLEEQLGRRCGYAYVKGSEATSTRCTEPPPAGGLRDRVHVDLARRTHPATNRFRLGRYNVEPYPSRTFELVLAGACDLIALKDTVAGTHARARSTRRSARPRGELRGRPLYPRLGAPTSSR